ncbi:alpha/beta fold hydrolase [Cupriavidus agavae]|uniref:Alpha-beta hydrolase superfamily lysophospholipase n=1 Tax=Cupriavidus agavae TaxID=1001822 RepID=A0A4Q7RS82_9BURK|nr:alpha/beta hydrolase [Cupriavidus agavae]RZT36464.1 alpha-beta hydrolase superfamily lysophospholipase [Cupriavidus agavae]
MANWIFLRGLTRESRHWGDLPVFWTRHGLGQPLLIDLPGNGQARSQPVPATVRGMADAVRQAAHASGTRGPWHILAMSLGAMVATDWAQTRPEDVAGLVLVNTSMRPFSRPTQRLRPQSWAAIAGMAHHWHDRARCERTIHRLTCERLDTRDADLARWVEIGESAPVTRDAAWRQLLAAARFRARPTAPACPTLIVSSDVDRLVDPQCSARLAAAWHAAHLGLARHPWAGHDLPHDDPAWLCETVGAFVRSA